MSFTYSVSPRFAAQRHDAWSMRGSRPAIGRAARTCCCRARLRAAHAFDSDTLISYELGFKAGWPDGTFMLDVAVFRLDWDDIQCSPRSAMSASNANGGTARSQGVEARSNDRPADRPDATVTSAYTDAELTEDTAARRRPRWRPAALRAGVGPSALSADYEWPVSATAEAYIGGGVRIPAIARRTSTTATSIGDIRVGRELHHASTSAPGSTSGKLERRGRMSGT